MKANTLAALCISLLVLAGCTTTPPSAPRATGGPIPANATDDSIQELVRVAVAAANPKAHRFTAQRGETLRQVMVRWTQSTQSKLVFQTDFNPTLVGAVNEADLHAGVVALSVLLQHTSNGAVVDLSTPGLVIVKNISSEK
ncbi:MAG: hypothetical protein ACOVSV_01865 [Fimbriimonadaceae bacterium]